MTDTKQPESHTTLYDVCQEVLRLESVNAELLKTLKALIDMDVAYQRGNKVEQAVEAAKAAIARAEVTK